MCCQAHAPQFKYSLCIIIIYTQLIRTLLEDLPRMFAGNKNAQCALGPALQAATKLLVSLNCVTVCACMHVYYLFNRLICLDCKIMSVTWGQIVTHKFSACMYNYDSVW